MGGTREQREKSKAQLERVALFLALFGVASSFASWWYPIIFREPNVYVALALALLCFGCVVAAFWIVFPPKSVRIGTLIGLSSVYFFVGYYALTHQYGPRRSKIEIVGSESGVDPFEVGKPPQMHITYVNSGGLRADLQAVYGVWFADFPSVDPKGVQWEEHVFEDFIESTKGYKLSTVHLDPKEKGEGFDVASWTLDQQQMSELQSGKRAVFFLGRIDYRDAAGWQTEEYCYYVGNAPMQPKDTIYRCRRHFGPVSN